MQKLTVIKVGGKIVEKDDTLTQLIKNFSTIPGPKVLVHGGGRSATRIANQLGIQSTMIGGRRVTDADMLRVVTMVYGGLVNKNIVAQLQACGINALGLTGADLNAIRSHKRPPKKTTLDDGTESMVDFGYVGDVDSANGQMLASLIQQGITPVMAPLTHDGQGNLLNTNADTIASTTAKALTPFFDVTLIFCFEHAGVLRNPDDETSVIPLIDEHLFQQYTTDGTISGGMIPKIENALEAIRAGVKQVIITREDAIDGTQGTTII
ncbi:MAG: acetylglutamate kinase [Bacteroidaceae bacterium]|nr:acetylglutamate kinase [Bacteroidaceae bacterium]